MSNKSWNDWKFQIPLNNLEWVNPRNCSERNIPFCVYSKKFYLKDNDKTSNWIGYSKFNPLD